MAPQPEKPKSAFASGFSMSQPKESGFGNFKMGTQEDEKNNQLSLSD